MEEITVNGIVLKSINYKEKDKIINIFTVELGNVSAILKGVSSAKAKMKFAWQPFCFAKFDLVKSNNYYVVKSVELIDTFFDLSLDYDNYLYGSSFLEVCNHILKPNIISENLFLLLLKTLKNIVYNDVDGLISAIKFYIEFLNIIGYKLNFDNCDLCGMKFLGDIKFNYHTGSFRCSNCSDDMPLSKQLFSSIKMIATTDIEKIKTLKLNKECLKECLNMLIKNVSDKINFKIKSFS